ncbi:MFS transporter [Streptomyces microflavus]|uniref:MFS transporter n=1 Tax=Streptomyces microflavus TaxID=1919 RepID=UPI002E0F41D7|nr:MFS transporter [Streptomyces microflavus]
MSHAEASKSPSPAPPEQVETTHPHLLRNKPFTRFMTGFSMSLLGDQIWFVALGWSASHLGSPLQTAAVMACASVPRALLILLGGTLSDRHGALRLALASQTLRVATMTVAFALLSLLGPSIVLLISVAVVFGAVDAVHMPAAASLPPKLVDKPSLPAAQGAVQTLERTATVAGAPLGGVLVAFHGLSAATAVNALLFLIALTVMRGLKKHTPITPSSQLTSESTWKSLRGGLSYVRTESLIGRLLLVITALNLCLAAPLNVGLALLASDRGWGATGFSTLITGFAAGAIAGALFTASRRSPSRPGATGLRWAACCGASIALLPWFTQLPLAAASAALIGFTIGPASALLFGLVQARTHDDYRGRVTSLATFSALGLTPISFTLFGLLASAFSPTTAILSCSVALTAASALAYSNHALRSATLKQPPSTD